MSLLTRLDRSAVLEIVLCIVLTVGTLAAAVSTGFEGVWFYIVMAIVFTACGVWLDQIHKRLKKRQATR